MGRTIPSFRIALATEQAKWKPFRKALDKSERKSFEMWDISKLYVSACSNYVQLVPLVSPHPIIISILFHHYKELKDCLSEVERIIEEEPATDSAADDEVNEVVEEALAPSTITTIPTKTTTKTTMLDSYFA